MPPARGDHMARIESRSRPVASFNHPVKVEVHKPTFELLQSARLLDFAKLQRTARAEIEIGYVRTRSCRQLVRATLRKGMVTGLVLEPCAELQRVEITPEIARVLKAARRRAASKGGRRPRF